VVAACDVLAVGAHPDDVELGCGATLAALAARGRRVGMLDLTAGELATRGDAAVRAAEAAGAAAALGAAWRHCLGLPDGAVDHRDDSQVRALVGAFRAAAPRVLLAPHPDDPHPDHLETARLCARAWFLAGLSAYAASGTPSRARLLLSYPGPRQLLAPALVVDVTSCYERKRNALLAHASQFTPTAGAPTHLASGHFLAAIEGRDRACGNTIGCELGEGFVSSRPLAATEIAWLLGAAEAPCESV
jgi:N-acetylglucosamine malate deacetylase 1